VLPVPPDAWTVPNVLSYLRLLALPVFVFLHLGGRPGWALLVFLAAALTMPWMGSWRGSSISKRSWARSWIRWRTSC